MSSGEVRLPDDWPISAPRSSSSRVIAALPSRTAKSSGVMPPLAVGKARCRMIPVPDAPPARAGTYSPLGIVTFVRALTSAPRARSNSTMSVWFSITAHISAVCACTVSLALTFAPRSSSSVAASTLPVRAAVISAVSPPGVAVFGSAPASSSARIIAALPLVAARPIGVIPYRFVTFTSAPALISAAAVGRSSRRTAQCNAVVPSGCGASMALRSRGKARSTSLSPLMTASATGASALAANPAHRPSKSPPPTIRC